jgi:hypothetical protein
MFRLTRTRINFAGLVALTAAAALFAWELGDTAGRLGLGPTRRSP